MYSYELEIKDTRESNTSVSYLDLLLSIRKDGQLHTSIYHKPDDFNYQITKFPFLSSNIPTLSAYGVFISHLIRYARACSSNECFILRATRLFKKASRTGIRQGTLEIVIEEALWSIRGSYQTIWSFLLTNVKWHSVTWSYSMITPYWSDFVPNSTFYRSSLSGFHRIICDGVACRQGTLSPPDTWSCPNWDLQMFFCWDHWHSIIQ